MRIKLLCFYVIMVQNLSFLNTIFVDNIVRFTCDNCSEAETCCLGTLIQPHIVLTTSFCANFCRVSRRGQIVHTIKIYTYPHYKKYFGLQDTGDFSNIALALFERMLSKRYVAISAVEPITTIGLKISIPVENKRKIRLQSTVIQRCENTYRQSSGLHVCTGKVISDLNSCQKVQGAPLLLTDRLLGMSIVHDCRLMQRVFIAVGPSVFWIHSTIEQLQRDHQNHFVLRNAVPTTPSLTPMEITTRWKENKNSRTSIMTTLTTNMKQVELTTKQFANMNQTITTTIEDVTLLDVIKNKSILLKPAPARSQNVRDAVTTSKEITSSLNSSDKTSETILTDFSMPLSNRSSFPKVMEWFKKKNNRLNEKPEVFLVLTRPPVRPPQETAEFIDLT